MKVLVVDDSEDNRRLLEATLKGMGNVTISSAASAQEAFDKLGIGGTPDTSIDVILLDILMPGINGIEACGIIKKNHAFADTPIIMVTSSSDEKDMQAAFAAGAIDYVSKPIRKIELRTRVNSVYLLKQEMDRRKSLLIELQEANRKLEFLSTHDGLTGLANRRFFDDSYEREWKRSIREHLPISIIMCDVDFFKLYNDTYGHRMGDNCLQSVAKVLAGEARRPGDIAARYGGEEFVIVLSNAETGVAVKIAERIRELVEKLAIPHEKSKAAKVVTMSLGVACMKPDKDSNFLKLLETADEALYRAKSEGRNRVIVATHIEG